MISGSSKKDSSLPLVLTGCDSYRCWVRGRRRQNCITKKVAMLHTTKLESMEPTRNPIEPLEEFAISSASSSTPHPWFFRVANRETRLWKTDMSQRWEFWGQPSMSHVKTLPLYTRRKALPDGNSLGAFPVILSITS